MSDVTREMVFPAGEIGDGGVWIRHETDPPDNRCHYELEYDWDDRGRDIDTVYLGDEAHVRHLIGVLQRLIDTDEADP